MGSSLFAASGLWRAGGPDQGQYPDPLLGQDKLSQDLKDLENRIQANPQDLAGRLELAVANKNRWNLERAVELFEEVVALDASHQRARLDLAELYFQMAEYDQAVAHLEALLEINPEHQLGLYWYGITLGSGKEDLPGGMRALERFLALKPTGPEAERARALIEEWGQKE